MFYFLIILLIFVKFVTVYANISLDTRCSITKYLI